MEGRRPSVGMRAPIMWLATTCTSSIRTRGDLACGASHDNRHLTPKPHRSIRCRQEYMVRAVKLQTSKSGTYYNLSLGAIATAAGTPVPDCQGTPGGSALPGTACNDGNSNTGNDVGRQLQLRRSAGRLSGYSVVPLFPVRHAMTAMRTRATTRGTRTATVWVSWSTVRVLRVVPPYRVRRAMMAMRTRATTPGTRAATAWVSIDCQGTPGGSALPGTACNDGNANTGNDTRDANCNCVGQLVDCQVLRVVPPYRVRRAMTAMRTRATTPGTRTATA